ncbi:MAG: phage portal protein [Candidatus Woesearchaeota archaeon]
MVKRKREKNSNDNQQTLVKSNTDTMNLDLAIEKDLHNLELQKVKIFDKAMKSGDPNIIMKATEYFGKNNQVTGSLIKSMLVDPLDFASSFGYKDKPTMLSYNMLKRMAKAPFTAMTINTRIAQVLKFCTPQENEYTVGFKIKMKDKDAKPSHADLKRMDELTEFILNCGFGYSWARDDFEKFIAKIVRDSLTLDQYTFEVLEDRKGIPKEFIATDASTYRIVFPDKGMQIKPDPITGEKCFPFYAQIYNGSVEQEFYPWELCFGVRRPRTDLEVAGYGYAELEELVGIITSMLWSDEYNRRFFSQGSAPKGIIRISGSNISESAIKEFKRQWYAQMAGVYNAWKTPIMEADKMDWIDLTKSNKDMEYSNWQEYLIKIHSALFLIDPSELGFDISRSSDSRPMFENNNMSRIKYSRDKGLIPILRNLEKSINRYLINRIDDRFVFKFVGDETLSEQEELEKAIKEVTNFKTVDEIRAKFDLEPLGEELGGNLILNSTWMTWYNNMLITKQQQQEEETEDEEEGFYDEEPEEEIEESIENPFVEDLNNFLKSLK